MQIISKHNFSSGLNNKHYYKDHCNCQSNSQKNMWGYESWKRWVFNWRQKVCKRNYM